MEIVGGYDQPTRKSRQREHEKRSSVARDWRIQEYKDQVQHGVVLIVRILRYKDPNMEGTSN